MTNTNYQILCDYDGVLIHKVNFTKSLQLKYGVKEKAMSDFFSKNLENCLIGNDDLIELLSKNLDVIGWKKSAQKLFESLYIETQSYNSKLIEFIKTNIRGQNQVHIATNQDYHRFNLIKNDKLVKDLFETVFCSCEFGVSKPNLIYFDKVYQLLKSKHKNINKDEIIFIDDLKENIEAAETYGFNAHLYVELNDFKNYYRRVISGLKFPKLESKKLNLVKMKLSHSKGYSEILSNKGTYQYLTESGPIDEERALEKIISNRNSFDSGKSIYWSIERNEKTFLGYIAIHNYNHEKVSISYGVHPFYRRQGIATEGLETVLKWKGIKGKLIELATHKENIASYQMLSKINLNYKGIKMTNFGKRHIFTIRI